MLVSFHNVKALLWKIQIDGGAGIVSDLSSDVWIHPYQKNFFVMLWCDTRMYQLWQLILLPLSVSLPHASATVVLCDHPSMPPYTQISGERRTVGSVIRYSCIGHRTIVGNTTRVCQLNGQWSGSPSHCTGNSLCLLTNAYNSTTNFLRLFKFQEYY